MEVSGSADWEAGWAAYEAAGGAWQPSCMVFPRDRPPKRPEDLPEALVRRLEEPTAEDARWLFEALKDPERKYFVAVLAEYARPLEGRFFTALLDAAVGEVNPSWNRVFIDPCLRAFGQRRVLLYLLRVIDRGANDRKAGAINALYWAGDEGEAAPGAFVLTAAYPNPFVERARFTLEVAEAQSVRVIVYDVMGREVIRLHDGPLAAGTRHGFEVDGRALASGVYLVRVDGEQVAETQRLTVLR